MFKSLSINHSVATDQLFFSKCSYTRSFNFVPYYHRFHPYSNGRVILHIQKTFMTSNIGNNAAGRNSSASRALSSSSLSPVPTLLPLSPEAIVKLIQQIRDANQSVSFDFVKDLLIFVHSKATSFTLEVSCHSLYSWIASCPARHIRQMCVLFVDYTRIFCQCLYGYQLNNKFQRRRRRSYSSMLLSLEPLIRHLHIFQMAT